MTLITFPARRAATAETEAKCVCGSSWFRPVRDTSAGARDGAVQLDSEGRVVGYVGTMRCVDCGSAYDA